MFSDQDINRHNYKLRFQEMENKIRKCELERTELEQRFAQLMRERQESEKSAARSLKAKYRRMMELENQRAERNESLLRMLHKIDQQAASLAAKSDRLKMLKTQYETYLMRSWSSQRALPPSPVPPQYSPQPQLLSLVPQSSSYLFPQRTTDSPRSEFVKYLSDMTHVQTVTHSPIPPPMALSNYISNSQQHQLHQPQHFTAGYHHSNPTWSQDLFLKPPHVEGTITSSPTGYNPEKFPEPVIPPTPRRGAPTQSTSKKFELSNEEFIQYIDNEILKGSTSASELNTIAAPEIVVDSPPRISSTPLPTAYLEDVINDEDQYQSTYNRSKDSPIIEEAVENLAELNLSNTSPSATMVEENPQMPPPPEVESAMNQRWEKVVEVDSVDDPRPMLASVETIEAVEEASPPYMQVSEQPLEGTSSKLGEYPLAQPEPIYGSSETDNQLKFVPEREEAVEQMKDNPQQNQAIFEEIQPEYPQTNAQQEDYQYDQPQQHYAELDYQPQQYVESQENYQEPPPSDYTSQEFIEQNYDNSSAIAQQEQQQQQPQESDVVTKPQSPYAQNGSQNYWTTARQAVKSKAYPGMIQSRTPETIQEIVDNGEPTQKPSVPPSPVEQTASTPPRSKQNSPTGENVSASEIRTSEPESVEQPPVDPIPEQQPTEQYDYSQYPQEYDPAAEQQQDYQYQQDGADSQYYQYQDQSGQDPSQAQEYQEYTDPNQYQQATEYPGPTQYVYDQGYYDQQQQDPNQQAYYDPNAPTEQQYYNSGEDQQQQQQQQSDPSYYDQSQTQDTYEQYQLSEPLASATEDSLQPQGESEDNTKMDQSHVEDSQPIVSSEGGSDKQQEKKQEGKSSPSGAVEEKNDTTISSANDESDFDFSTQ